LDKYQALKLGKKHKYILFGLDKDNKEIIVQKCSESVDYDDFLNDLPETECKWAVYDFEFEKEDGGKRNKLVFYSW
jgi:cofilin